MKKIYKKHKTIRGFRKIAKTREPISTILIVKGLWITNLVIIVIGGIGVVMMNY
jgi:hypothetical protein